MITKNYIKMCEMAEEIQKEWGCRKGDWVKYKDDVIVLKQGYLDVEILEREYLIFCNDITEINGLVFGDKKYQFIHLPTQEQLQEMISCNWYDVFCKFLWWYSDDDKSGEEFKSMFTSMNELWLLCVMKEKYNKVWDEEKWKE